MDGMRKAIFLFAALIFVCPAHASAAAPPLIPEKCAKGVVTSDPSGTKAFSVSQVELLKSHLNQVVYCASACFDEDITVTVSSGALADIEVTVETIASNKCTKTNEDPKGEDPEKDRRGCKTSYTQPPIVIKNSGITGISSAKTIGPKSPVTRA